MKYFYLSCLFLLAACVFSGPPEQLRYRIDPAALAPTTEAAGVKSRNIVRVALPEGDFGLESERIQVQTADLHITGVENAVWIDPLNKMLEPLLIGALENSGLFAGVIDDNSPVAANLELQTTIERFTLVYPSDSGSLRVEVALRADLIKLPENTLIFSRRFAASEPVQTGHMPYIIAAFERALLQCLKNLIQGFDQHPAILPANPPG